ncbi:hypothetical protein ACW14X_28830 [Nocardioides sp. YJ-D4]
MGVVDTVELRVYAVALGEPDRSTLYLCCWPPHLRPGHVTNVGPARHQGGGAWSRHALTGVRATAAMHGDSFPGTYPRQGNQSWRNRRPEHLASGITKKSTRLGLGSLWFAEGRNRVLAPADTQDGIAAAQRIVLAQESRQPQRIALTLASIKAFPMTHHVEAVALLERHGG